MRSFFCDKCNLEFDLDEDFDDDDNTVFCPQCKINLARILPETPERILMRAKRQQELRMKQLKARTRMLLVTAGILVVTNLLMQIRPASFFMMLTAGLLAGIPAGIWTRHLTVDRTFRAGLFAILLLAVILAAECAVLYACGRLPVWYPALRNLTGGLIPAYIIAIWDRST
jgi:glucose-6-phosphate-specific signal transduction histidine kinase